MSTPRPNSDPRPIGEILAQIGRLRTMQARPVVEPPPVLMPLDRLLTLARVPHAAREMLRQPLCDSETRCIARAWYEGRRRVLVLTGTSGTGKTTAALDVLRAHVVRDRETGAAQPGALYARAEDLSELGRDDWARHRLESVPLLVLDDLGRTYHRESGQSWGLAVLGSILDHRSMTGGRVLATSNYAGRVLLNRLGADPEECARNWRRLDGDEPGAHVAVMRTWREGV